MAQMLAIDWDETEVRFVLARSEGGRLRISSVGTSPIPAQEPPGVASVAQAIQAALGGRKLGRCSVLVGVGRADLEFLALTLPPAKEVELPDLVAHAILRQSPQLSDNATVDFLPLSDSPAEPRLVSAAVCPAGRIEQIVACCQGAGLRVDRILVRPHALRALLPREEPPPSAALLVCQVADEIDLAVVAGGRVHYARTVKLPKRADAESVRERLLAEIQRTVLVAPQSHAGGQSIQQICVFGREDELQPLLERVAAELAVPAAAIDPFARATVDMDVIPARTDRFAPLIGMLQDEIKKTHPLDFLHPRKPPPPPNRRRQLALAAAVLAVLAAGIGWHVWRTLQALDAKNAELQLELNRLDKELKKATTRRRVAESIQEWQTNSVNWLDELREFSLRFPNSRDAVVLHLALTPSRSGGGEMDLNAVVRDPAIVLRMENNIRDGFHQVSGKNIQERGQAKNYSWHFDSRIRIAPRSKEQYLAQARGKQPPAEKREASGNQAGTVPVAAPAPSANAAPAAPPPKGPPRE